MRKPLKAGFVLSYAAIFIQSAVSILYTPFMLRILGESEYGLLQLAISAVSHLGLLSFGFSGSYLKFYTQYRVSGNKNKICVLNGMFLTVFLCASLLSLILGGVITAFTHVIFSRSMSADEIDAMRILLGLMTVNLALSFPNNVFDGFIVAHEKFTFQKLLVILSTLLNPMLTFPILIMGKGNVGVGVCMCAISALKLIISGVYCVSRLDMKFMMTRKIKEFSPLFAFSFFVFLNIVSDQINWSTDKTILGIVRGAKEVTLYSLGAQFNTYFLTFSYALSSLFSPKAYRIAISRHSGDMLDRFFARYGKIQLTVMGFIYLMLIALGRPFIRLWSGLDSNIPYYTAVILISPLLITSIQSIGIEIQRAKDMHRFRSILYFAIAGFNILISIPLCVKFGALGGAWGTAVCLVVGNIFIMNWYYHKKVGVNMFYFWTQIINMLPSFVLPVVCAVCLNIFIKDNALSLIIGGVAFTAVYSLSALILGIGRDIKRDMAA